MIITIDGPAGTGKSTVAKLVAKKLSFLYIDTGAMFRTLAYGILLASINYQNPEVLAKFLSDHPVSMSPDATRFFLGDIDATPHLRTPEVAQFASKIATLPEVREALKTAQRAVVVGKDCVFEGRDMGTVVFPKAECKVFLTATSAVRAKRRHDELVQKMAESAPPYEQVLKEIIERDERDMNRAIAPLRAASDAHTLDTSTLTIEQVVDTIYGFVKK